MSVLTVNRRVVWPVLAWAGAMAYPAVLFFTMTNRHGGYGDGELRIEIEDEGCGGMVGAGFGIVGLLRGEFTAGPRSGGGGFRVAARIPA